METYVGLSGERVDPRLSELVAGVGLLRSEYIFRRCGHYLADSVGQSNLQSYVEDVLAKFAGLPVWYRFCDAPSNEINMLEGERCVHRRRVPNGWNQRNEAGCLPPGDVRARIRFGL